jgi:hypothetical protein
MRQRSRWAVVAVLLGAGALLSPVAVPLYDGVGFPDEPYRFVPARGDGPAATTATVSLRVTGGVNSGGLLANSAELGPQVSVYAPPRAFEVAGGTTAPITLTARPVPLSPPPPPGQVESNVYALALTSPQGAVSFRSDAQQPGITLRAVSVQQPLPVAYYRPGPDRPWKQLVTRRVGRDNFNAVAPGQGEYVLMRPAAAPGGKDAGGSSRGLLVVLGVVVLLMVGVVVGVRVLSRRPIDEST